MTTPKYPSERVGFKTYHHHCGARVEEENKKRLEDELEKSSNPRKAVK